MEVTAAERARRLKITDYGEQRSWNDSEPETQLSVPPLFLDGSPHVRFDPECCAYFAGNTCEECGVGVMHYQPCYGGVWRECDYCGHST